MNKPLKIAVLVSGSGTNLQALIDSIAAGNLDVEIVYVVSSNAKAKGIARAEKAGIETIVFEPRDYEESPEGVDRKMAEAFGAAGVEYVVMAGYMRKITPVLLEAFPNKVVNLHPALLPKHPGAHAIQDAYDAGDEVTGITIHFANEEYDEGPIIYQHEVPVHEGESVDELEERIHAAEHEWYPKVVQWLAEGRVSVQDGVCEVAEA